jgi:hypothetical protein
MTQTLSPKAAPAPTATNTRVLKRILDEGYGPGAWHGADLKAAVSDVPPSLAFHRPAADRHNIAEIVMHHAWCVRSVVSQLSGAEPEPFVLAGEDWFPLNGDRDLSWKDILATLDEQQRRLSTLIERTGGGGESALDDEKTLGLVLGITCHAIYHAGQVQLIKVLTRPHEG